MQAFALKNVLAEHQKAGRMYHEFLRVPALSAGIYRLPAGEEDPQKPHAEDEIYHVLEGRAKFTSGGKTVDAQPGSVLYVPAREAHKFHDIAQDLTVLVLFAPAETAPS